MSSQTQMTMAQLRGRVPLNVDHKNNYNAATVAQPAKGRDLHHNKNYNIFEEPVYVPMQQQQSPGYQYGRDPQHELQRAVEYVQGSNPNAVDRFSGLDVGDLPQVRPSPIKTKGGKIGALYKPTHIDPRVHSHESQQPLAGVRTNYGYTTTEQQRKQFVENIAKYPQNNMRNPYELQGAPEPLFAQGPGTGTFMPGKAAAIKRHASQLEGRLNHSSSLQKAGMRAMDSQGISSNVSRVNPGQYGQLALEQEQQYEYDLNPYRSVGRHDSNPNSMKNLKYLQEAAKQPSFKSAMQQYPEAVGAKMSGNSRQRNQYASIDFDSREQAALPQSFDARQQGAMPLSPQQQMGMGAGTMQPPMADMLRERSRADPSRDSAEGEKMNGQASPTAGYNMHGGYVQPPQPATDANRLLTHNTKVPMAQKRHYSPAGGRAPNRDRTGEILNHASGSGQPGLPHQLAEEQDIYNREKLLLEQDAHLLEEQRYLNRLKQSELKQGAHFTNHYEKITRADHEMKAHMNSKENAEIERRLLAYADFQSQKAKIQKDLNQLHATAITRQIASGRERRRQELQHKQTDKQIMEQKGQLDQYGFRVPGL